MKRRRIRSETMLPKSARRAAPDDSTLSQKAILVGVNIQQWTGRKLDRRITNEVNEEHATTPDAGRYNKLLIKKERFTPIHQLTNRARAEHFLLTQPWFDEGARLLPTALVDRFYTAFHAYRTEFDALADEFAENFDRYKRERRKELNGMYDEKDYPDASKVRGLFRFDVRTLPCPSVDDFRVTLAKEHAQDIKDELAERLRAGLKDAMNEPVRRIVQVVGRMSERLNAYRPASGKGDRAEGTFKDSLVENVRELADLLPAFNLTDDARLNELAERMKNDLCGADAQLLREDPRVRKSVAASADDILTQANALMA